jgi:NAD(P)H-hydrate repair Nnr-like enzyme with NAD(P)H-hydrate dehydratase domain
MAEKQAKDVANQEKIQEKKVAVLVLKGAATLVSGGKKFVKDVPQQVEDPELAKRLLASGLFETAGDKR